MLPFEMIAGGTYTVPTTGGVTVALQAQNPPDFIITKSITGWGLASTAQSIEWWWERSMAQYTAKGLQQGSDATNPPITSKSLATLGISQYDTTNPPAFTGLAGTAISGNTAAYVVLMTNTGTIQVGDWVLLTGVVGEPQLNGYRFQVTAVTVNTSITLGYMASGGISLPSAATAVLVTKYIPGRFYPHFRFIAGITNATQATVYFTGQNDFTPGEFISFRIPPNFGMIPLNNVVARVLTVTNSSTVSSVTLDWDTSGYPAFTFPTNAQAVTMSPAVAVPSSSGVVPSNGSATIPQSPPGTNLQDSFDNRNVRLISFGSGLFNVASFVVPAGQTWMWQAYKYSLYNTY
jgi:hypothetical protein